jgi:hypothetical protein
MPAFQIPAGLPEILPRALAEAERATTPADKRAVAVALDKLWRFGETFGLWKRPATKEAVADATRFYADVLAELPSDLVMKAVDEVCRTHKWGNRLPLPADLSATVSAEMSARKQELIRLRLAKAKLDRDPPKPERPPPTPEQVARVRAMVAGIAQQGSGDAATPPACS